MILYPYELYKCGNKNNAGWFMVCIRRSRTPMRIAAGINYIKSCHETSSAEPCVLSNIYSDMASGNIKPMKLIQSTKFSPWNLLMKLSTPSDRGSILEDIEACDHLSKPTWSDVMLVIGGNLKNVIWQETMETIDRQ